MLDIRSKTWESDRSKAVSELVHGTISPEDERILRNATSTAQWNFLLRQKWAVDHKALIDEVRASNDLICRMFVALAERP